MTIPKTLTLTRHLAAKPARVYDALTDPKARMIWGAPDADSVVLIEEAPTPAEGLREMSRVGPKDNPYVTVWTDWILLRPERVTYAETLLAEGAALGITLATCDLAPSATGTDLTLTLQIVSYTGDEVIDEMASGWSHAIGALERYCAKQTA